jgi:hypothetical protein
MHIKHADTDEEHNANLGSCLCAPEWVHIEKTAKEGHVPFRHTHSFDALDRFLRSHALKVFARSKVEQGPYTPLAMLEWMKAKSGDRTKQLEYLTDHDIAAFAWRTIRDSAAEMKHEVEDENAEEQERAKCIDAVATTTVHGLRQAFIMLMRTYPDARRLSNPFSIPRKKTRRKRAKKLSRVLWKAKTSAFHNQAFHRGCEMGRSIVERKAGNHR